MTTQDERDAIIDAARQGAGQDWRVFFDSPTEHTYAGVIVSLADEVEGLHAALAAATARAEREEGRARHCRTILQTIYRDNKRGLPDGVAEEIEAIILPSADARAGTRDAVIEKARAMLSFLPNPADPETYDDDGEHTVPWIFPVAAMMAESDLIDAIDALAGAAGMGEGEMGT